MMYNVIFQLKFIRESNFQPCLSLSHPEIWFFRIDKILYIPGCPSVGWSVGRSVCLLIEIQSIEATGLKLGG